MPLSRNERVVTVCALAVENRHLLEPEELAWIAGLSEADLRAGCATISSRAHQTNANPVLRQQIVAINFHQSARVERTAVADDVQVAIAIDVAEAKAVVHGSSRLVLDAPRFVHVSEVTSADAAQQPEKMPPIPDDVGDSIVVEVGHNGQTPRSVARFAGRFHTSERVGHPREFSLAVVQVDFGSFVLQHDEVEISVLIHIPNAFDHETVLVQTDFRGRIAEVHRSIVEIDPRLATLVIVAAPLHGQIDEPVPVEVRRMHVDLIACRRNFEMTARREISFGIAELEDNARPLVQPIHFAIAVQINHRVDPTLAGTYGGLAEAQSSWRGFVDPPFAAAVLPRHLQVELSVFVDVVREVNLRSRIRAPGLAEMATTVIEEGERAACAMCREKQIEMAIAVEVHKVQSA